MEQGAVVADLTMGEEAPAIGEGMFAVHGQTGVTQGEAIGVELSGLGASPFGEGYSREPADLIEVVVGEKAVERGIEGGERGAKAEATFGGLDQGQEVGQVGSVEGLGQLGQDELSPAGDFGGHNAGAIAPVDFGDRGLGRRSGQRGGGGYRPVISGRLVLVAASFDPQPTIGVGSWLAGLVIAAFFNESARIVLLYPGDDMLGIQGDGSPEVRLRGQFVLQNMNGAVEQELQDLVVERAQDRQEEPLVRDARVGVEAPREGRSRMQGKAQNPDQGRVIDQVVPQVGHIAFVLVKLDQVGGHKGGARARGEAGPGTTWVPFGKVLPVQRPQQPQVALGYATVLHELGKGLRSAGQLRQIGAVKGWIDQGSPHPTPGATGSSQPIGHLCAFRYHECVSF